MPELIWNVGDPNMTHLRGYLDTDIPLAEVVARLKALGAEDEGPGDKTEYEFVGRFDGHVFTLYDWKGGRILHVGGHGDLPVTALVAHLRTLLAL